MTDTISLSQRFFLVAPLVLGLIQIHALGNSVAVDELVLITAPKNTKKQRIIKAAEVAVLSAATLASAVMIGIAVNECSKQAGKKPTDKPVGDQSASDQSVGDQPVGDYPVSLAPRQADNQNDLHQNSIDISPRGQPNNPVFGSSAGSHQVSTLILNSDNSLSSGFLNGSGRTGNIVFPKYSEGLLLKKNAPNQANLPQKFDSLLFEEASDPVFLDRRMKSLPLCHEKFTGKDLWNAVGRLPCGKEACQALATIGQYEHKAPIKVIDSLRCMVALKYDRTSFTDVREAISDTYRIYRDFKAVFADSDRSLARVEGLLKTNARSSAWILGLDVAFKFDSDVPLRDLEGRSFYMINTESGQVKSFVYGETVPLSVATPRLSYYWLHPSKAGLEAEYVKINDGLMLELWRNNVQECRRVSSNSSRLAWLWAMKKKQEEEDACIENGTSIRPSDAWDLCRVLPQDMVREIAEFLPRGASRRMEALLDRMASNSR